MTTTTGFNEDNRCNYYGKQLIDFCINSDMYIMMFKQLVRYQEHLHVYRVNNAVQLIVILPPPQSQNALNKYCTCSLGIRTITDILPAD